MTEKQSAFQELERLIEELEAIKNQLPEIAELEGVLDDLQDIVFEYGAEYD